MRRSPGALLVVAGIVCVVVWHAFLQHWVAIHTGTLNESGPYYGFWSGFGSDLGEATIFTGIIVGYRHHNCHVRRCPRLGRPVEGTPYVACPKHHPAHEGRRRSVRLETIHKAHQERIRR